MPHKRNNVWCIYRVYVQFDNNDLTPIKNIVQYGAVYVQYIHSLYDCLLSKGLLSLGLLCANFMDSGSER